MSNHPNTGAVMTVDGPADPSNLGPTLTHEHILIDIRNYCPEPTSETERALADAPVTIERLGVLRRDPTRVRDNFLLADKELAAKELRRFADCGGGTIVDVSPLGIRAGTVSDIREICGKANLQAVVCCGYYVQASHPADIASRSVESLAEQFILEANDGIDGTGIKPGIIGEIGISQPGHPDEWKVLDAACRAQVETGLPMCVHPYFGQRSRMAPDVVRFVVDRGVDPGRLNLCHMDGYMNIEYQQRVMDMGAWISFDTFGLEVYFDQFPDRNRTAPDVLRERHLIELLELGYAGQILLSHDVCSKMQTREFGGYGYGHLLENIFPALEFEGVEKATLDRLIVDNPARYLTIA